ncbi:MAG: FG-GAP repeat protein [Ignavibacteriae bacterium]|nr:FG-GAP repeat protein [Ignavibacteriota bacterium]
MRFIYKNKGFVVSPRITETYKNDKNNPFAEKEKIKVSDDWKVEFTVLGYGRNNRIEHELWGNEFIVEENIAFINDKNMKVDYLNNEEGMRQDFTIYTKPIQSRGMLTLSLEVKTNERIIVGADALVIKGENSQEYMRYKNLKIWDAKGKILRGWFEEVENNVSNSLKKINIVVNDKNAKYPIFIDPLSTTEDWSKEGNQLDAEFGFRVATAGDVNGDGFSDVMISAPYFDDKGKVFVFHGSATGPSINPDWEMLGSQQDGLFGYSISTAGDIDANGYSDIIVGIPNYGSSLVNEGRVIVYYGFSGGLSYDEGEIVSGGIQNIQLGYSVSTAGDFNGDGYSDVAFSAPFYTLGQTEEGKLFVYYGSQNGLELSTFWSTEGNVDNMQLGTNLSTAGDFNGDGYSDIIVGNPNYEVYVGVNPLNSAGMFAIYFGSGSGITSYIFKKGNEASGHLGKSVFTAGDVNGDGYSDVIIGRNSTIDAVYRGVAEVYHGYDFDSDNITSFELAQAPDWSADLSSSIIVDGFGDAVSTAGDVNGDGFADVVIGAKSFYVDGNFVGGAFLYHGSLSGLESNYAWMVEGSQNNGLYGKSVGIAGDVNGDGYSDIIIGESDFNNKGKAYIYYGSLNGMIDNDPEELYGTQIGSEAGTSVSTAGDVNGDGYSDIIIGVPEFSNVQQSEGAVFVYYGTSDGIDQANKLILEGNQDNANFGSSVSTAGDVNGDGYVDVIIGMPGKTIGVNKVGAAYIYHGSLSGLSVTPSNMINGDQSNSGYGFSVSTAGDVNGDGYSDIIIGASTYGLGAKGAAFVHYGSSSGVSNTPNWTKEGVNASFLGNSVSAAGDVNGDGYSDVIIGAYDFSNGQVAEGAVYVFHGSASGLSQNADWSIESNQDYASIGLDVSSAGDVNGDGYGDIVFSGYNSTNKEGVVYLYHGSGTGLETNSNWSFLGSQNFGQYGFSVNTAGDMNGDGYSDVIVGQYGFDNIGSGVDFDGKVYLYKGSENGLGIAEVWSGLGGEEFEYGISVSTAGDVNGDGYSDILIGAPGYNGTTIHGGAYLYYGNARGSLESRIRQSNPSTGDRLAAGNLTESSGSVQLGLRIKSPFGRADGRAVYEFRKHGEIFSQGTSYSNSVMFYGTSTFEDLIINPKGKPILTTANGLASSYSDAYQWRTRKEFSLVNNPYQKYGPWKYYSAFDPIQPYAFRPRVYIPLNIIAQIKVLLEGTYDESSNNMFTYINSNIPTTSPYEDLRETSLPIPGNAVDWIFVELRDKNDVSKVLASKSGFLLQDKTIRELDGTSPLSFNLPEDDYYIVVKHRNHLAVMSSSPVHLTSN